MALEPGQLIDNKYRVVRLIGEGGMGAVYEGENARIRRRVAIKTLHAAIANNAEVVTRFEREAQAAGRIGSDHILEVLDLGALPNGDRYIVMEFLDGEPLSKRIERFGRLSPGQLLPIMRQVLDGLGAAHAAGIIHRDLKPENIFILKQKAGRQDYVKLIDFGISKFQSDQQSMAMTRTGTMMGTPLYMSPEQANGSAEADARSDLYAIGVIMYEALTGSTPFTAKTFNELLFQIVLLDIPPLQSVVPGLDPEFSAIVQRAMARDRSQRFQSTAELWQALEAWQTRTGTKSERPPPPSGFAETAAASSAAAFASSSSPAIVNTPAPLGMTPGGSPQFASGGYPAQPQQAQPAFQQTPLPATNVGLPVPQQGEANRNTQNSWGASQPGITPQAKPKSKAPLFAVLALGGLVVLGGIGFGVSRVVGGSEKATTASEGKGGDEKKPEEKSEGDKPKQDPKADKATDNGDKPAEKADPKPEQAPQPTAEPTPPAPTAQPTAPVATATKPDPKKPTTTATVAGKPTAAPSTKGTAGGKKGGGNPADWGY